MSGNSSKSFERRCLMSCAPANLLSGLFIYLYTITVVQLDKALWGVAFLVVAFIVLGCQILLAPLTNILVSRRLSRGLEEWREKGLSPGRRTELLYRLQAFPRRKQAEAYLYFSVGTGVLALGYAYFLKLGWLDIIACVSICLFCTHIAGILNFFTSIKLCSDYARRLIEQGVDQQMLRQRQPLGVNLGRSFVQLMALPAIFTTLLFSTTYTINYLANGGRMDRTSMSIVGAVIVVNMVASLVLTLLLFAAVLRSSRMLQESMERITQSDIFTVKPISTDLANEISYNMYLANDIIHLFQSVLTGIRSIGLDMLPAIDELHRIVDKTTLGSYQQAASIQQMIATIQERESQVRELDRRMASFAETTAAMVRHMDCERGILGESMENMDEIARSIEASISEIWTLGKKINGVWDIVSAISSIADRTRIIGFNIELRVAEAGSTGSNSLIIANEIKRLATSIADSVLVIQGRISEMQESSDNLVISTEGGTERVREEGELGRQLADKMEEVGRSISIAEESMEDIDLIVRQQIQGIHRISQTMDRISIGIEEVSASMSMVTDITEGLKNTAYRLENLSREIVQSEDIHPESAQEEAQA